MTTYNIPYHLTVTSRIINEYIDGWEFSCQYCGYQSRFFIERGEQRFEIINPGDSNARHTSNPVNFEHFEDTFPNKDKSSGNDHKNYFDHEQEIKLPPNLEKQLKEILKRLNFDN